MSLENSKKRTRNLDSAKRKESPNKNKISKSSHKEWDSKLRAQIEDSKAKISESEKLLHENKKVASEVSKGFLGKVLSIKKGLDKSLLVRAKEAVNLINENLLSLDNLAGFLKKNQASYKEIYEEFKNELEGSELLEGAIATQTQIDEIDNKRLNQTFEEELSKLEKKMRVGDPGFLVDGQNQKMYKIERTENGFKFIQSNVISTAAAGFSEIPNSNATPRGIFMISNWTVKADFGGIIKGKKPKDKNVETLQYKGTEDQITTAALYLIGLEPSNRSTYKRGIAIHGTSSEDDIGTPASHGCVRTTNLDILPIYKEVKQRSRKQKRTYVYITDRPTMPPASMMASSDKPKDNV